jgi:hypothetical protein
LLEASIERSELIQLHMLERGFVIGYAAMIEMMKRLFPFVRKAYQSHAPVALRFVCCNVLALLQPFDHSGHVLFCHERIFT